MFYQYEANEKKRGEYYKADGSDAEVAYTLDISLNLIHSVRNKPRVVLVFIYFDCMFFDIVLYHHISFIVQNAKEGKILYGIIKKSHSSSFSILSIISRKLVNKGRYFCITTCCVSLAADSS